MENLQNKRNTMNKNEAEQKLKKIIQDLACVDEINPESKLEEDLDIDSLDRVELLMYIEEEFDIEIDDEKAMKCKTFQNLVDYVWNLIPE